MDQPTIVPPGMKLSVSAGEPQGMQGHPENYAFVMNVSRLVGATSFTMAAGHELRRANSQEIAVIKTTVQPYMVFGTMPWEVRLLEGGASERLPEADWRYHVISFQGNNETLVEIEEACSLAPVELKIGFVILRWFGDRPMNPGQHGYIMHQGRLFQMLDRALWSIAFSEVSASDVEGIRALHSQLIQHDAKVVDVRCLVQQLHQLEAVPSYSSLRFLGYFAMLEGLLAHSPKPTDPYESITRQIKKKVTLLDHRCKPRIDYSAFGDANVETIWKKMYDYRSCLAHGGTPDFEREHTILGNHDRALSLIKDTVKAVLRQALIEPQLLADLREC